MGAGLQYVRDNVFTASSGSRRLEGVTQILVLLSGGKSSDSVDAAASSLKELGVLTFGIGLFCFRTSSILRWHICSGFINWINLFSEEVFVSDVHGLPIYCGNSSGVCPFLQKNSSANVCR